MRYMILLAATLWSVVPSQGAEYGAAGARDLYYPACLTLEAATKLADSIEKQSDQAPKFDLFGLMYNNRLCETSPIGTVVSHRVVKRSVLNKNTYVVETVVVHVKYKNGHKRYFIFKKEAGRSI